MESLKFTLEGSVPSKKNSRQLFVRGGKMFNIPQKNYREWHEMASWQLKNKVSEPISKCEIEITFYSGDKRKYDLTNKAESVMDLLVDNGIIDDDNYEVVSKLTLIYGGYDKSNPRVEINIYNVKLYDSRRNK